MKEGNDRLTIWIDPDIKRQAKSRAATNEVTLSAVIEDLLKHYIRNKCLEMRDGVGNRQNGKSK